jgi:uncharacterized protein with PIN domain
MIVDSSAIVAILKQEPDWKEFLKYPERCK